MLDFRVICVDSPTFSPRDRCPTSRLSRAAGARSGIVKAEDLSMQRQLIFDIGMCNGDDDAYYLRKGFDVIAVEANPLLCEQCRQRFSQEISEGRITIVNAGILERPGDFTFYENVTEPGWSSFTAGGRVGGAGDWRERRVTCITTLDLIQRYGSPFYIKVDIEGADLQALKTLDGPLAPPYISVELDREDPILEALIDLGYSAFKFVDGLNYRPAPPIFDNEIGWRLLRKACHSFPPFKGVVAKLPPILRTKDYFNPPGKFSPDGYAFTDYCSGPFGEETAGRWLRPAEAMKWFRKFQKGLNSSKAMQSFWWDVHARHGSVAQ